MLGDNSYPLYIGIAILKQLKSTLLSSGFNECILLFSDLPDIVMENCVFESQQMYEATPKSIAHRFHVNRQEKMGPFVRQFYRNFYCANCICICYTFFRTSLPT